MRLSKCGIVLAAVMAGSLSISAMAHDGSANLVFPSWDAMQYQHDDAADWKGWFTLTATNSSLNTWRGFHFEIYGASNDVNQVVFTIPPQPISSQLLTSAVVGTTLDSRSMLDLYFPTDPVAPGGSATFQVWTDNTAAQNAWFGIAVYPTPEPTTVALLALGAAGLIRRRR